MSESGGAESGNGGSGGNRGADERKGRVVLRPATRADFDAMLAEPLPYRSRAMTGEIDGRILGVGGIAYLPDGTIAAFLHAIPEARSYAVSLHRAAKMILRWIREENVPRVVALAQEDIEPAKRWLARLGFESKYIDDKEVWIWQPSSRSH